MKVADVENLDPLRSSDLLKCCRKGEVKMRIITGTKEVQMFETNFFGVSRLSMSVR